MKQIAAWINSNQALEEETRNHRHTLHQIPEIGFDLPQTSHYVFSTLEQYGYKPRWMAGSGIVADIGSGDTMLLLRADMDALPMKEETNLDFASNNGAMHSCGHDLHMAMLLGAAKYIIEHQHELKQKIRLMFQPDEESVQGANAMIAQGVLDGVSHALALHCEIGKDPMGTLRYIENETTAASDIFEIEIQGKSAHGAMPYQGVDPINVGAHIYLGLQALIARELNAFHPTVLTIGCFQAGKNHNIIPEVALLRGTLRTFDTADRTMILSRMQEIIEFQAKSFQATAKLTIKQSVDSIVNDPSWLQHVGTQIEPWFGPLWQKRSEPWIVSEDFCWISKQVPSAFLTLSCGNAEEGHPYALHNCKATFDDAALLYGVKALIEVAMK
ncbi:MAG: M20 metallopeptidase family protein [Erysipelotrichaceae bacterium]